MKRCLNWWDLTWVGFGAVIGAGIFVITGQEAHFDAGPSIVVSYLASGFTTMLGVFIYTEFAVEIPVAGGSFAYLRVELGDFVAFVAAANILLDYMLGNAAVARSWTSYLTTLLNRPSNSLVIHTNLKQEYNLLDPIAVIVLAIASAIAIASTKKTSLINWIASAVNMVVIIFWLFQAAAIVGFAYGGFDAITTLAEETKKPSRDIPIGLLGSMSVITVIYCVMALSLSMMQKYTDIDPHAAYSVAFESVGMNWAKYLVAFGALKGMTTVLLVAALAQARYATHIARAHMIPPWFASPKRLFSLHAAADRASGEEILRNRHHASRERVEVRCVAASHSPFLCFDLSLLGTDLHRLDRLHHYTPSLVLGDSGDVGALAAAKDAQSLGRSACPVVPIVGDCDEFFPHGIFGCQCFYTVQHMYGHDYGLLFLFWAPCDL
ncbi:hypothetical protein C3L33_23311, partial [Rhododendron williamsianum]